ncbi:hypothetical protein RCL_jg10263.t1 [Rhizophagus clarus]|uniref:Uncharacterized protein n=1 Tax=Rhizophagus clarus TaxID=94130 RepID=A0A8H3KWI0_9GLOM|nr:hypothetical protein RCL_jg10263.t1 [Rhizophagus clarus]
MSGKTDWETKNPYASLNAHLIAMTKTKSPHGQKQLWKTLDDQIKILTEHFGQPAHPNAPVYTSITKHLLGPSPIISLLINVGLKAGLSALYPTFELVKDLITNNPTDAASDLSHDIEDIVEQDTNSSLSRIILEVPPMPISDKTTPMPSFSKSGKDKTESYQQTFDGEKWCHRLDDLEVKWFPGKWTLKQKCNHSTFMV